MRIATNSYTDAMISQFNNLTAQQDILQNEVSTGLSIQSPSDNPVGMQNTLDYLANASAQNQYSSNISTLQSRATLTYSATQSLQQIISQAGTIATEATSGTASQSTLNNYASQVSSLISQALSIANTTDPATGQSLFGGTSGSQPAFTATTDANGDITAVTYNGNSSVNQSQIGQDETVTVDVPGENNSGTGPQGLITDSRTGADLFNHLIALRNDLTSGNTSAISSTDSPNIQKDENNISYQVSNNGVIQSQLNAASSTTSSNLSSLNTSISNTSGADLVQTIMKLNQAQNSYEAALASGSKIMQLSLVNFLD